MATGLKQDAQDEALNRFDHWPRGCGLQGFRADSRNCVRRVGRLPNVPSVSSGQVLAVEGPRSESAHFVATISIYATTAE
jgi:hypothetical protein